MSDTVSGRTLVAGVGNVFLRDDAFGVEVIRLLAGRPVPDGQQPDHLDAEGVVAQEHVAHARHQRPPAHGTPS